MSKLLKFHVIGTAVDGNPQPTAANAPSDGAATGLPVTEAASKPTQSEPDIFKLPPLPANQKAPEAASSR